MYVVLIILIRICYIKVHILISIQGWAKVAYIHEYIKQSLFFYYLFLYYILFHTKNCKPTFAHCCIEYISPVYILMLYTIYTLYSMYFNKYIFNTSICTLIYTYIYTHTQIHIYVYAYICTHTLKYKYPQYRQHNFTSVKKSAHLHLYLCLCAHTHKRLEGNPARGYHPGLW